MNETSDAVDFLGLEIARRWVGFRGKRGFDDGYRGAFVLPCKANRGRIMSRRWPVKTTEICDLPDVVPDPRIRI